MSDPRSTSDANAQSYSAELLAENAKWARRVNQTFPQYFPDPEHKQAPKIIWIGCSDSRVQESDALAALPGLTFVHRNIANQVHPKDDSALSVLAYALDVLEVQHIAIVGHSHCGGVISALKNRTGPAISDGTTYHYMLQDSFHHIVEILEGHPDRVYDEQSYKPGDVITRWLTPLVEHLRKVQLPPDPKEQLRAAVAENVKLQVENFTKTPLNEFVKAASKKKPIWVHGWVYEIENGSIRNLNITKEIQ